MRCERRRIAQLTDWIDRLCALVSDTELDPFLVQSLHWPTLHGGDGEVGRSSNYLPPKNLTLSIIAGP